MKIETKRLILRNYKLNDAPDILKIWKQKEIVKWIEGIPYPCTEKKIKEILEFVK
jgi:hypothetical protein